MPPTTRRPRTVDTSSNFCPHTDCAYRGWLGLNNLRANGHPSGGPWRQFHCIAATAIFRASRHEFSWQTGSRELMAAGWQGLGIRAVARVFEVDPNTVLAWLIEVADHATAFSRYFLHDVRVTQVQLDELFALLSAVKMGEVSAAEAVERLARSPHWVWAAIDPVTKLPLTVDVGDRTRAMAQRVVHQVVQVVAPGCVPLFLTDGFKEYTTALLTHYGSGSSRRARGTRPGAETTLDAMARAVSAQGIKTVRRRRLVRVRHRVVVGTLEAVEHVLAACGWQLNTAFIERLNLSFRQHVAAVGRRVTTLCKGEQGLHRSWQCITRTTTFASRMPVCANRGRSPCPPMALAPPSAGSHDTGHGRWTDGSCLDPERSLTSGAAVAPARGGVSTRW